MERSDIDIAVSGGDFDAFFEDVMTGVHSLLIFDVVKLDSFTSDALKKEIIRDGVAIYEET